MKKFDIGLVIPSYGHFPYVESAIRSAFATTTASLCVLLLDDASPDWEAAGNPLYERLKAEFGDRLRGISYAENGGLTRSWNAGLSYFNSPECRTKFICCANSDLIFGRHWDKPLCVAAETHAIVGPLTNTPGTCKHQNVKNWLSVYKPYDAVDYVNSIGHMLYKHYVNEVETVNAINGFCLFAKRETWFSGAYDADHVFRPRNDFNSKGQPNPTPLMTLNEDELQARWRLLGRRAGVCLGSFVFHYRSVSRGERYAKGDWVRKK